MGKNEKKLERPGVQGWLHDSGPSPKGALVLTHGAGSDCEAPLLVAVAQAFVGLGYVVLRFNLPYRQARSKGSPHPSHAAKDREGIRLAVAALRDTLPESASSVPVVLGGQSYGGRQSSMAAAEDPKLADALLLLSYPLHPPGQANKLRTEHFPSLHTSAYFVHGTRDGFGSIDEIEAARKLIPARTAIDVIQGGGHGVPPKVAGDVASRFVAWMSV